MRIVDESGADILFNSDHFFPSVGDPTGSNFEAWTMLGAWAQQTRNVHIGVSVSGNGYRNPHLLADMARTVDHISQGRAILGIGSGWFRKDFEEYGFVFPDDETRIAEFRRTLEAFDYRMPRLNPPPVQKRLPVMIGNGGDRKPPGLVARHADIWLDFKPLADIAAYNEELDGECRLIGRDPSDIERGAALYPDELHRALDYVAAGCTLFTLRCMGPDYRLDLLNAWLSWRDRENAETPASEPIG